MNDSTSTSHISDGAQKLRDLIGSGMSLDEIKRAAKPYREFAPEVMRLENEDLLAVQGEVARLNASLKEKTAEKEVVEAAIQWLESAPHVLQPNNCSRAHKLIESLLSGPSAGMRDVHRTFITGMLQDATSFVVRHDWASAFGESLDDAAGDIKLPYEACLFEFTINGRCVIIAAHQADSAGVRPQAIPFVEVLDGRWYQGSAGDCEGDSVFSMAWRQVVAVCVALDAEVATHAVTRAPHALNKKRERTGKPPLKDFHVVDLSRRARAIPAPALATGRTHRLHFRRGHWRHYDDHKTWIKWTLVGNPDLGFVDKQYRV